MRRCPSSSIWTQARRPNAPPVYHAQRSPQSAVARRVPARANLPLTGNVRGPDTHGQPRRRRAGLRPRPKSWSKANIGTQIQTHCCMEPHAIVADWRPDGLTVYMSTQFTAGVRQELAESIRLAAQPGSRRSSMRWAAASARSRNSAITAASPSSCRARRVRRCGSCSSATRSISTPATGRRLGSVYAIGALRDGTSDGDFACRSYGTAGVGLGAGVGNFAQALYICPNFSSRAERRVHQRRSRARRCADPATRRARSPWNRRSTSSPKRLGIDPLALRERIDPSPVRREERRIGAERIGWEQRHTPDADAGPIKRGLGMAQSLWGANVQTQRSLRGARPCATVRCRSCRACRISAPASARSWHRWSPKSSGLQPNAITVRIGDTDFPAGPPSLGQPARPPRLTPPARTAAWQIRQLLFRQAAPKLGVAPEN